MLRLAWCPPQEEMKFVQFLMSRPMTYEQCAQIITRGYVACSAHTERHIRAKDCLRCSNSHTILSFGIFCCPLFTAPSQFVVVIMIRNDQVWYERCCCN